MISDPVVLFKGKTDDVQYTEVYQENDSHAVVKIKCRNQFADFERVSGRRTNDVEHKKFFPGDKAMEFVADLVAKVITWKLR